MAKTIPTNPDARSYNGLLPGTDILAEDVGATVEAQHYVLAKRGRLLLSRNFVADDATNNGLKEQSTSLTERIQTKIYYNAHNTSTYRPQIVVGVRAASAGGGSTGTVRVAVGAVTGDMTYTAGAGYKYDSVTLTPEATGELTFTVSMKVATTGNIIMTDVWAYETDISAGDMP